MSDRPPRPCPGSNCRGQFLFLRNYGIICTLHWAQLGTKEAIRIAHGKPNRVLVRAISEEGVGL